MGTKRNKITEALIAKIDSVELEKIGLIIDTSEHKGALYMGNGVMKLASGTVIDVPINSVRAVRLSAAVAPASVPTVTVSASKPAKSLFKV